MGEQILRSKIWPDQRGRPSNNADDKQQLQGAASPTASASPTSQERVSNSACLHAQRAIAVMSQKKIVLTKEDDKEFVGKALAAVDQFMADESAGKGASSSCMQARIKLHVCLCVRVQTARLQLVPAPRALRKHRGGVCVLLRRGKEADFFQTWVQKYPSVVFETKPTDIAWK